MDKVRSKSYECCMAQCFVPGVGGFHRDVSGNAEGGSGESSNGRSYTNAFIFDTLYRRDYLLSMEGAALLKEISNDFSDYPSLSFFSPKIAVQWFLIGYNMPM